MRRHRQNAISFVLDEPDLQNHHRHKRQQFVCLISKYILGNQISVLFQANYRLILRLSFFESYQAKSINVVLHFYKRYFVRVCQPRPQQQSAHYHESHKLIDSRLPAV